MDTHRMKIAAQWFRNKVFQEESIRPRAPQKQPSLPSVLRAARSLENGPHQKWQSRESVFIKQAKLLVNYEDDYDFQGSATHYYPTYEALSDQELRGYFSWRTKVRKGDVRKTSLSFAFLYIYELINQIGVADAEDGYRRLTAFRDAYGTLDGGILSYLKRWLVDYVVYYGLDPALLSGSPQAAFDRSITVLEHIQERDTAEVMDAVKHLSPKWLARSRFYAANQEVMDEVTVRVLRRMSAHYASRCKKTLVEQYFGESSRHYMRPFEAAVFCDPLKHWNYEYAVDEQYVFRCENGSWSVQRRTLTPSSAGKLDALLKTIDSVLRQETGFKHPVQVGVETKWVLKIIAEEVRAVLDAQKAAEEKKVVIDYRQLARIRQDAAVTQEKLTVEEELEEPDLPPVQEAPVVSGPEEGTLLAPAEYRLVRCLLYGGDLGWVQSEGHLLSVLVDGVNDKLYDTFQDTVLEDGPQVVEDYIEDLKEMVHP